MYGQKRLRSFAPVLLAFLAVDANAQIPLEVYENPSNLQILSSDISPEQLRDTMLSIGQQVGIRCSRCHDFDANTPFDKQDYSSDSAELKRVAREMMLMVQGINETLSAIDRGRDHKGLTVQCVTCHRGVSRPRQIEDIFEHTMNEEGLAAAIVEYKELREIWYAMSAYDFTAWKLGEVAQSIIDAGNTEGGMDVHALNFELNSGDGSIYYHRGETYEKQGRFGDAIKDYQRALEMEPESLGFLEDRIARLQEQMHER